MKINRARQVYKARVHRTDCESFMPTALVQAEGVESRVSNVQGCTSLAGKALLSYSFCF